jgi:hypothetical protein
MTIYDDQRRMPLHSLKDGSFNGGQSLRRVYIADYDRIPNFAHVRLPACIVPMPVIRYYERYRE